MSLKLSSGKQLKSRLVARILINFPFSLLSKTFCCYFDENRKQVLLTIANPLTIMQFHVACGTRNLGSK